MRKIIPIVLGILLVFLAFWSSITNNTWVLLLKERIENIGYDIQLRSHALLQRQVKRGSLSPDIAIINVDEKSLQKEGRWPWPRKKLATLIDLLQAHGVTMISFDFIFPENQLNSAENVLNTLTTNSQFSSYCAKQLEENTPQFDEDAIFAKTIAINRVLLALAFLPYYSAQNTLPAPLITLTPQQASELQITTAQGYLSNIPILQQAARGSGFINAIPDNDGIIRHSSLLIKYKDGIYPALSLQTIISIFGDKPKLVVKSYGHTQKIEGIQLGDRVIPTDETGKVIIPFIGRSHTFPYYSATDVLNNNIPNEALLGKIVLVGTSAVGLGDLHATAIQSPYPGVEIQATLINGILKNNFSYKPAWVNTANISLAIILGLIAAFVFPYLGPRSLAAISIIFPILAQMINNAIWERTGLILAFSLTIILIVAIAIFNIIYGYLFETRKREQLKAMFGQYVHEKHIDEMLATKKSELVLHSEDREMTVLFADIRNFTMITEDMNAHQIVEMLNTFFNPMTEILLQNKGTIDKYVGDQIIAFWGAPLPDKNHAFHAIEAALKMQKQVKQLSKLSTVHGLAGIKIGIGINTGIMSVGDMGSRYRRNYTVLGDSVNLASRIESLSKLYGVDIIVSEYSKQDQNLFVFRELDRVRVKGKKNAVTIYEAICKVEQLTNEIKYELDLFQKGLVFYFSQQWVAALGVMTELNHAHPGKKLYLIYLERIKEYMEHPLPADWDGVYINLAK